MNFTKKFVFKVSQLLLTLIVVLYCVESKYEVFPKEDYYINNIINYLLTKSEAFMEKSQTEALPY